jgi:hypothetical protein
MNLADLNGHSSFAQFRSTKFAMSDSTLVPCANSATRTLPEVK